MTDEGPPSNGAARLELRLFEEIASLREQRAELMRQLAACRQEIRAVTRGHRLQAVVEAGLAPSVRWLEDQIRARRIPARKIGRHWVMTDADIDAALEVWSNKREPEQTSETGGFLSLTPTSQRRRCGPPEAIRCR